MKTENVPFSFIVFIFVVCMIGIGATGAVRFQAKFRELQTTVEELKMTVGEYDQRILDAARPPRIIADVSVDPRFWEDIQNQIDELSDRVDQCETAKSFVPSDRKYKSMDRSLSK